MKIYKNNELNALPIYDNRYIKTKIRTYGDRLYANFHDINVPEDDIECKSFPVISIGSSLVYQNKYYLQVYLENCAYRVIDNQMIDYLDENIFENRSYKCCITIELI